MCVTAIVTLAITLIFKTSFTTNFSQGVISAFGAFVASWAISRMGLPVIVGILLSILTSMTIAALVDVGIFRRGRYVNALGKQIITMGMISIVIGIIPLVFDTSVYTYVVNPIIKDKLIIDVGGNVSITVTNNAIFCVGITIAIVSVIFVLLKFSKWGLSVRATASNEYVAGMMGINTHVVTAVSWGLAGGLGALAAYMKATDGAAISGYFMTEYQVTAFLAGILGGFGTFYGPVVCAVLIPLLEGLVFAILNILKLYEYTGWSKVIVYAIAMVIIFFKPQGIFGKKIARKV